MRSRRLAKRRELNLGGAGQAERIGSDHGAMFNCACRRRVQGDVVRRAEQLRISVGRSECDALAMLAAKVANLRARRA